MLIKVMRMPIANAISSAAQGDGPQAGNSALTPFQHATTNPEANGNATSDCGVMNVPEVAVWPVVVVVVSDCA
jgi:hypothetical protein